jgi:hypothetical protein
MEKAGEILWPFGIHYWHLVHFMATWKFSVNLVYFPKFWYIVSRRIWQPPYTHASMSYVDDR